MRRMLHTIALASAMLKVVDALPESYRDTAAFPRRAAMMSIAAGIRASG